MTVPLRQVDLRFGFVPANDFSNSGFYDPWPSSFQHAHVEFAPPFDNDDVRYSSRQLTNHLRRMITMQQWLAWLTMLR
jgi:hypothetical protein